MKEYTTRYKIKTYFEWCNMFEPDILNCKWHGKYKAFSIVTVMYLYFPGTMEHANYIIKNGYLNFWVVE